MSGPGAPIKTLSKPYQNTFKTLPKPYNSTNPRSPTCSSPILWGVLAHKNLPYIMSRFASLRSALDAITFVPDGLP